MGETYFTCPNGGLLSLQPVENSFVRDLENQLLHGNGIELTAVGYARRPSFESNYHATLILQDTDGFLYEADPDASMVWLRAHSLKAYLGGEYLEDLERCFPFEPARLLGTFFAKRGITCLPPIINHEKSLYISLHDPFIKSTRLYKFLHDYLFSTIREYQCLIGIYIGRDNPLFYSFGLVFSHKLKPIYIYFISKTGKHIPELLPLDVIQKLDADLLPDEVVADPTCFTSIKTTQYLTTRILHKIPKGILRYVSRNLALIASRHAPPTVSTAKIPSLQLPFQNKWNAVADHLSRLKGGKWCGEEIELAPNETLIIMDLPSGDILDQVISRLLFTRCTPAEVLGVRIHKRKTNRGLTFSIVLVCLTPGAPQPCVREINLELLTCSLVANDCSGYMVTRDNISDSFKVHSSFQSRSVVTKQIMLRRAYYARSEWRLRTVLGTPSL
ncbi:GckA/TtuD-like superfamily motif protein [Ranid herpesvirus 3]|uniref:GckA/TtuD-like superfamily motif protein n=1 Tax=Ranid herpesvirus 3 TaxID=1987509 RepID=A0A1X9T546_9VIRU|nr:GckA/TtuD-like superfamily motif protein [Ranid herpesvirus 3]ARR28821.1 GckA/TtuD-like superfamily motif protein [Ranid herpesvirus 3]